MSISKILKIENAVTTRTDKRIPDLSVDLNQITITFEEKKPFREFIELVQLKNENGKNLSYNDGAKNRPLHGPINTSKLRLYFDIDDCLLLDGASFIIVLKDRATGEFKKHIFVLSNNEWIEKDGGSVPCPA